MKFISINKAHVVQLHLFIFSRCVVILWSHGQKFSAFITPHTHTCIDNTGEAMAHRDRCGAQQQSAMAIPLIPGRFMVLIMHGLAFPSQPVYFVYLASWSRLNYSALYHSMLVAPSNLINTHDKLEPPLNGLFNVARGTINFATDQSSGM